MSKSKPEEFNAFEKLTKQLLTVPKQELDKQVGEYEKRKTARKKRESQKRA